MGYIKKHLSRVIPSLFFVLAYCIDILWMGSSYVLLSPPIIFFYVFSNPLLLHPLILVGITFFTDIYCGFPPGLNSFPIFLFYALIIFYRKNIRSPDFTSVWGLFAILLLATQCTKWLLLSVIQNHYWPMQYILMPSLFTAILYPWFQIFLPKQH